MEGEFVHDYEIEINGMSGTYTGPLAHGMPNGYGTMDYTDAIYEGKWRNGNKHGLGTMKWFEWFDEERHVSQTHKGEWANDKPIENRSVRNSPRKGGKTKRKRQGNKNKNRRTKHNRKR